MTDRKILLNIIEDIQSKLIIKDYEYVNSFLNELDVTTLNTSVLIGILMFILSWRESINYDLFYKKCRDFIMINHSVEKTERLLQGLM